MPQAAIKGKDEELHSTVTVGCNDMSPPSIPASGTTLLNLQ